MIIVRDEFQLRFGRAREAIALMQEGLELMRRDPAMRDSRLLTDLTGEYYRIVLESGHESLASYEATLNREMAAPEWKSWYAKFTPLVERGRREIFKVVGSQVPPLRTAQESAGAALGRS